MNELLKHWHRKEDCVKVIQQMQYTRSQTSKKVIISKIKKINGYHEYSDDLLEFLLKEMYD